MRQNPKLGIQASTSSVCMRNLDTALSSMQSQSSLSASSMTSMSSVISQQTITLAQQSGFSLLYLLSSAATFSIGANVTANISSVLGYNPNYTSPQNLSSVGLQAQAVIQVSANISSEVANYCQQFYDLAQSVNANCTTCPTNQTCQQVINKWQNASLSVEFLANSTVVNSTLIRTANLTVQGTLIDAISSTNILIKNMTECAKCLNTGCTRNQAVAIRPCSKGNGSKSTSERKEACRRKASESAKRMQRIASKGRKNKGNKSKQRQKGMEKKNKDHWKNVWTQANQMASNFFMNITIAPIQNIFVRSKFLN